MVGMRAPRPFHLESARPSSLALADLRRLHASRTF